MFDSLFFKSVKYYRNTMCAGSQSGNYITPVLNSSNCIISGQCVSSGTLQNGTMCSVQYTTDAQYRGLSEAITVPLNTAFQLPPLDSDTTFYFIFTVPVTSTFLVNKQVEFTTGSSTILMVFMTLYSMKELLH